MVETTISILFHGLKLTKTWGLGPVTSKIGGVGLLLILGYDSRSLL